MKHLFLTAALLFVPAATASAQAAPPPSDAPDFSTEQLGGERAAPQRPASQRILIPAGLLYASFDTDGNYAASRAELNAGVLRSFAVADKNSNNSLSLVELSNWREAVLGSRDLLPGNTQFDKNFDNQISTEEFQITLSDLFEGFDRNENGQLEFSEMTRDAPRGRRGEGGGENSEKRERPSGGKGRGGGRSQRGG